MMMRQDVVVGVAMVRRLMVMVVHRLWVERVVRCVLVLHISIVGLMRRLVVVAAVVEMMV